MTSHCELSALQGLGPKSAKTLNTVGIYTRQDLEQKGAVETFAALQKSGVKPSLNFLYAMAGALENRHWQDIAKSDHRRLKLELDGYTSLQHIFDQNEA